jgi:hypothetical protein
MGEKGQRLEPAIAELGGEGVLFDGGLLGAGDRGEDGDADGKIGSWRLRH